MSRISLFVAALSLSGVALADGQLEGVVFESGTGAPWPNAVLHLETDAALIGDEIAIGAGIGGALLGITALSEMVGQMGFFQ